jgi:hypothetical protein
MNWTTFAVLGFAVFVGRPAGIARAQDAIVIETPPSAGSTVVLKNQQTYDEYRLGELQIRAKRSRNALIGLSAASVVGTALLFPGFANQCFVVRFLDGTEELRCTSAGKAMVGLGWPLFLGGLTGVLISGIMFGVRQGKIRRLSDQIEREKRAFRWDPAASAFVF